MSMYIFACEADFHVLPLIGAKQPLQINSSVRLTDQPNARFNRSNGIVGNYGLENDQPTDHDRPTQHTDIRDQAALPTINHPVYNNEYYLSSSLSQPLYFLSFYPWLIFSAQARIQTKKLHFLSCQTALFMFYQGLIEKFHVFQQISVNV